MSARAALIFALLAAPAFADDADCQAVRRVLALANRSELDVGRLAQLEPRVCGQPAPTACEQLGDFWMLSMALKQPQETSSALEAERATWCSRAGEPTRMRQWPDGTVLRTTSGTLSWPNGTMARSSSGSWWSPEGVLVRSSSGSLSASCTACSHGCCLRPLMRGVGP